MRWARRPGCSGGTSDFARQRRSGGLGGERGLDPAEIGIGGKGTDPGDGFQFTWSFKTEKGALDKAAAFGEMLSGLGLEENAAGYMGDELVDLPVLCRCGFAATVPEAPETLRKRAHYVTRSGGGRGAAREVCEFVMRVQGTLESAINAFLPRGGR